MAGEIAQLRVPQMIMMVRNTGKKSVEYGNIKNIALKKTRAITIVFLDPHKSVITPPRPPPTTAEKPKMR